MVQCIKTLYSNRYCGSVSWAFYSIIKRNHSLHAFECDVIFDENESNMEDFEPYSQDEPLTEWNDVYDQLAYVFDCGEVSQCLVVIHNSRC